MFKKNVTPLPEGFVDSFGGVSKRLNADPLNEAISPLDKTGTYRLAKIFNDKPMGKPFKYEMDLRTGLGEQDWKAHSDLKLKGYISFEKSGSYPKITTTVTVKKPLIKKITNEETDSFLNEMRQPYIVVDADNKVLGTASDEKGAKSIISSSERPPMSVPDKTKLRIVKSRKKQYIGMPLKEAEAAHDNMFEGKMDDVNPKALKKDFDDRKDKDIDNDGDVDNSDEYLHNRRKAVSKAMNEVSNESVTEAKLSHDRYKRSHMKDASRTATGMWMFTNKQSGNPDWNNDEEVFEFQGKGAEAFKAAKQWADKLGHSTVYVMESTAPLAKSGLFTESEIEKMFAIEMRFQSDINPG